MFCAKEERRGPYVSPKYFSTVCDMWSYASFCSAVRSEGLIGGKRSDILDVDFQLDNYFVFEW